MASARILGCAVQVSEEKYKHGTVDYSRYTISGEGAKRLHVICDQHGMCPSSFDDGTFGYDSMNYDNFNATPTMQAIRDGLKNAVQEAHIS